MFLGLKFIAAVTVSSLVVKLKLSNVVAKKPTPDEIIEAKEVYIQLIRYMSIIKGSWCCVSELFQYILWVLK